MPPLLIHHLGLTSFIRLCSGSKYMMSHNARALTMQSTGRYKRTDGHVARLSYLQIYQTDCFGSKCISVTPTVTATELTSDRISDVGHQSVSLHLLRPRPLFLASLRPGKTGQQAPILPRLLNTGIDINKGTCVKAHIPGSC